ncbi:hypothetical protein, partial [Rubneribacter badeniensis]|uniref:hypothetical protein n=1 Tax=Rubneribacter badeniensis TaxID=2070688 RepID=UPI003A8DF35F
MMLVEAESACRANPIGETERPFAQWRSLLPGLIARNPIRDPANADPHRPWFGTEPLEMPPEESEDEWVRRDRMSTGYWLLATGYWLLATGYWLLATGYWLLATGYWLLATGYWLLATGYW